MTRTHILRPPFPHRVLAVAATVVMAAGGITGCAKYDGDQAAFCKLLPAAPTFMDIGLQTMQGTADEAADKLDETSAAFRELERVAPRDIRAKVAALGDASERLASRIRKEQLPATGTPPWADPSDVDVEAVDPSAGWSPRQDALMNEILGHPSVGEAATALFNYSSDTCDIADPQNLLGTYGVTDYSSMTDGALDGDGTPRSDDGVTVELGTDGATVIPGTGTIAPGLTTVPAAPAP